MADSSGAHKPLRLEWVETCADVSYRYVVSLDTLRAATFVARAVLQKKRSWWQRAVLVVMGPTLRLIIVTLVAVFFGWLSLQPAIVIYRALDATQRPGIAAPVAIVTFLVAYLCIGVAFRIAIRNLVRLSFVRPYREFYSGNEFLLEGRKSYLWLEERSAGTIRRWSTFERLVEFEDGMWLFLRPGTTFAGLRGILISKESLPNSCAWSELQMYLTQRIEEGAGYVGSSEPG